MGLFVAICSLAARLPGCGGGERQDEDEPEGEFPVEIVGAEFPAKQRLAQTSDLTLSVANVGDETIPDLAVTDLHRCRHRASRSTRTRTPSRDDRDRGPRARPRPTPRRTRGGARQRGRDQAAAGGAREQAEADDDRGRRREDADDRGRGDVPRRRRCPQADGAFSVLSEQPDLAIPSRPVWILEQGYPRLAGTEAGAAARGRDQRRRRRRGRPDQHLQLRRARARTRRRDRLAGDRRCRPGTYTVHYRLAAGLQGKAVAVNDDGTVPEGEFVVQISDVPPQTRVDDAGKVVPIKKGDIIGQAGTRRAAGRARPLAYR